MVPSDEDLQRLVALLRKTGSLQELKMEVRECANDASEQDSNFLYELMILLDVHLEKTLQYLNQARGTLGLKPYDTPKAGDEKAQTAPEETSTPRRGKVGGAKRSEQKFT